MATIFSLPAESQPISGKSPVLQSSPPVEVYPATTDIDYTSVDQELEALRSWIETNPRGLLKLRNISFEQAEALQVALRNKGYKVRYVSLETELAWSSPHT